MAEIEVLLEGLGLTKSEIKVYLALIEIGSSSTGKIVDKSGASSSKIYEILDKLIQKGLVSYVLKANVKYYEAAPPERILDYIEEKKTAIVRQESEVRKVLPQLELKRSLAGIGSETQVFKGMKGAKTAFDDITHTLKKNDKYLVLAHSEVKPEFQRFLTNFHTKRSKAGIKCDIIVNELAKKDWEPIEKLSHTKIKYVPKELFTPFAFIIYKDKVLISISAEQVFIQIKSSRLADGLRSYFDYLWDQKTKTYVGKESLRTLFTEMLEFGDYVVYAEVTRIMDVLGPEFFMQWQFEKKKRGIKSRGIMGAKHRAHKAAKGSITDFKFIPGYENPTGDLFIFKDKVVNVVYTTKEPIAFLIDSREVAENNTSQFEMLWNQKVQSYQGQESVEAAYESLLSIAKPDDEVIVFAAKPRSERGRDYNLQWSKKIRQMVKRFRLIYYGYNEENKRRAEEFSKIGCETKIVPTAETVPISIVVIGSSILYSIYEKTPMAFEIENNIVADSFRSNFELLWEQETTVGKGLDALNTALANYLDDLEPGETFNVLGVTFGLKDYSFYKEEYKNAFKDIHQKRADKGIKAKLLFQQADPAMIEKFRKEVYNKNHEAKVLPFKTKFPVAILPSKNQTVMIVHKKEPAIITINNKEASSAFKEYFDSMWQQDVRVYKGFEDVTSRFRQNMQEMKEGDEYYVLGSALQYEEKTKLENYFMDYHAERVKRKIKVKLLAIPESYDVIYKEFTETGDPQMKYAELKRLPPEFKYPMQITLYKGNKISLISWTEDLCFEIESKTMYDSFKANFDMLWKIPQKHL